jgi:alanine racemase
MDYSMIFFKNDVFRIGDEVTLSSYSYPNLANWSKITNMIIYELLTYINPNIQRQLIKK